MRIAVIGSFIFWTAVAVSCSTSAEACDMENAVFEETTEIEVSALGL